MFYSLLLADAEVVSPEADAGRFKCMEVMILIRAAVVIIII